MKKRILWFCNVPLPEASILMSKKTQPYGGWLVMTSKDLSETENIELAVAFPNKSTHGVEVFKGDKITYYAFEPVTIKNVDNIRIENNLKNIIDAFSPNLIHFFGTEYPHTFLGLNIVDKNRTVVSIQGLISSCAVHYSDGIESKYLYRKTIRDLIRKDSIYSQKQDFFNRGIYEKEAIKISKHIIGRTEWDKAIVEIINPLVCYHHCGETLRNIFYKNQWKFEECEEYSIFISQGEYPLKGLHNFIKAMPMIVDKFPSTKLYVGGKNIINQANWKQKIRLTYYGKYILQLINRYNLENHIIFTGVLNEEEMCHRFRKSNVFVSCSNLENSPNSLGEAMLLGVPSVAAYVGGIPNFITHGIDGYLYQHNDPYMLAHYINKIFMDENNSKKISTASRNRALEVYNSENNLKDLLTIYQKILNDA